MKTIFLTIFATAGSWLIGSPLVRGQTLDTSDSLLVMRTAIAQTRAEFAANTRLYLDTSRPSRHSQPSGQLAAAVASAVGASLAQLEEVFECAPTADGNRRCSGDATVVSVSSPWYEDGEVVVRVTYVFLGPDGGLPSVSIKLLMRKAGGAWGVVRELEREIT